MAVAIDIIGVGLTYQSTLQIPDQEDLKQGHLKRKIMKGWFNIVKWTNQYNFNQWAFDEPHGSIYIDLPHGGI